LLLDAAGRIARELCRTNQEFSLTSPTTVLHAHISPVGPLVAAVQRRSLALSMITIIKINAGIMGYEDEKRSRPASSSLNIHVLEFPYRLHIKRLMLVCGTGVW
jgi:hypothetical protein